jgi:hypothetical protein
MPQGKTPAIVAHDIQTLQEAIHEFRSYQSYMASEYPEAPGYEGIRYLTESILTGLDQQLNYFNSLAFQSDSEDALDISGNQDNIEVLIDALNNLNPGTYTIILEI